MRGQNRFTRHGRAVVFGVGLLLDIGFARLSIAQESAGADKDEDSAKVGQVDEPSEKPPAAPQDSTNTEPVAPPSSSAASITLPAHAAFPGEPAPARRDRQPPTGRQKPVQTAPAPVPPSA